MQKDDQGRERVIEYWSRNLRKHELNYATTDIEGLAIIEGVRNFKKYLGVTTFEIVTDHKALVTIKTQELPDKRRARWIEELERYEYTTRHCKPTT